MSDDSAPQAPVDPPSVGAALVAAREEHSLSIEDVSASTRLRTHVIRQLERDDFSSCGGPVYARGHIKSIARVVGADVDELLAQFDRENGQKADDEAARSPLPTFEAQRETRVRRWNPQWISVALAVIGVVGAFLLISAVVNSDDVATNSSRNPTSSTPAPPSRSSATTGPGSSPTNAVNLHIQATTESAWVQVSRSDGSQLYEGTLQPGQGIDVSDAEYLQTTFGNSTAVELTLNGRKIGSPSCDAEDVCSMEFEAAGAATHSTVTATPSPSDNSPSPSASSSESASRQPMPSRQSTPSISATSPAFEDEADSAEVPE